MAINTHETYNCDKCGKKLSTCDNTLDIVTSEYEGTSWARLHVRIQYVHGVHNYYDTDNADLCKNCAVDLLRDALNRVLKGERASAGTEDIAISTWK